jgi:dTDP-3-amino-2,3,6-trideoxy-4-keto-D-glucose/dTDP-3-amino-3,4,6-trideoxy-alpha-D-glucose/dTDP-2,6-dideoxy-D-kanosamine transaminase
MAINVWSYLREYENERADILAAVDRVFSSGTLVLGESVRRFESDFAAWCGVRSGVGVDNGTNAVSLALRAVGVKGGDDVVTVSNTAAPTVIAINSIGARARFVDIDPKSYLMDVQKLEEAITPRTTCIVPVHLFGQCVDMDVVLEVARRKGLRVVEDCAQSHGARYRGRPAGSMSDAAAFSFYPTKVLGAYGDGGMVITNDAELERRLRRLRYYGMEDRYYVVDEGFNSRLDEVQAAILSTKLARVGQYVERRRALAALYRKRLAGVDIRLPVERDGNEHVYYVYVARHPKRDAILERLRERQINLNVSYRWPVHTMTGFAHLGYKMGDLPHTEAAAEEIFSLPMFPSLTDEEHGVVCGALSEVIAEV